MDEYYEIIFPLDLGTTAATLQAKVASVEVRLKQMLDQVDVLDRSTSKQLYDLLGQCGKLEDGVISLEEKLEYVIQYHIISKSS